MKIRRIRSLRKSLVSYLERVRAVHLAERQSEAGLVILQHLLLQCDLTQSLFHCHEFSMQMRVLPFELLQVPLAVTQNDFLTLFLCVTYT